MGVLFGRRLLQGAAACSLFVGFLAGCADSLESAGPSAQSSSLMMSGTAVVPPAVTPTTVGTLAPAGATPNTTVLPPASQRPRAQAGTALRTPEAVAAAPVASSPAPRRSGKTAVTCATIKQGQDSYETADIVCKNTTELIHTVYLDINAPGYTNLPSEVALRGGYLLAPGESERVARLKVASRPAMLAVNTRAVPFKAVQMPG